MKKYKHSQMWYMEKCRDIVLEIGRLSSTDTFAFIRLRRKAEKYLQIAKDMEKEKS
jgi:hypothetical protein